MNKYKCKIANRGKVGEVSSKYGYDKNGTQFIADVEKHINRQNYLWAEFIEFMKSHNIEPTEIRTMFTRYYEEFIK